MHECDEQCFSLKVLRNNCFFGIGLTSCEDRKLKEFQILTYDGNIITKNESGNYCTSSRVLFKVGGVIQITIRDEQITVACDDGKWTSEYQN